MQKRLATVNETRHLRTLHPGETVFRRMPAKARAPKHLLGEPSRGPYVVVSQSNACMTYLGRKFGLAGATPLALARAVQTRTPRHCCRGR